MLKTLILISGIPGAGKTRFADYLSKKLQLALICKDRVKEKIWDKVHYDSRKRDEAKIYFGLAYDLSFFFCETIMKTNQSLVFESNFVSPADDVLNSLAQQYGYRVINVLFDGDHKTIHKRFVERDISSERHPGLVSNGFYDDFELFDKAVSNCSNFKYGDVLINVDATDFLKISYDDLVEKILSA